MHRKRFEAAVCLAVVLHKYDVPDFNNLGVVFIDQFAARRFGFLLRCARVKMNLGAWTARTGFTHFPKVVVFIAVNDVVGGYMLQPISGSFIVA